MTWLFALFVGHLCGTGTCDGLSSQAHFDAVVFGVVIAFVPMVAAISGNSGIQISTVIVRGFATGQLADSRVRAALSREGGIAWLLIVAPVCGLIAAAIGTVWCSLIVFH